MAKFLRLNQPACILLWLAVAYNLVLPLPGIWYDILFYAGLILLVGHFGEWVALRGRLQQLGHTPGRSFVPVMIYGFFWWLPIILDGKNSTGGDRD